MNYYEEIKRKLIDNEIYQRTKDYSKERNTVLTYFEIGKLLSEAGKEYGKNIIDEYSKKLMVEVGKKYNRRTLFRMRQFYNLFNNEKVSPLVTQLCWSHFLQLISLKNYDEILYYINICVDQNLSKRELETKIKNKEYERLDEKTKNKLINKEKTEIIDYVKNPILIRNSFNYKQMSEKILKRLIIEDLDNFLKEIGIGLCYIQNEYKIKIGDKYNYIDLLLYNIKYKCYCVVELKVTELKKEHIGQIEIYMNYIDKNVKSLDEDKTIGIIICKKDNHFVMEYCSDKRILAREYSFI